MRKTDLFINHEERDERGQSLVEFVLVLPIILVLIAGVLEVTNILLKYNNVQQAAREGARYAAGGGVDNGVDEVVLDTISNNLNEDNVNSIWIIRPQVAFSGGALTWHDLGGSSAWLVDEVCVYPKPCTDTSSGLSESLVRNNFNDAQGELPSGRQSIVEDLSGEVLAIVVVNYEAQTILNLSFFNYFGPGGTLPLRAWTVMRQEIESETLEKFNSGCNAYPIAINMSHEDNGIQISGASEGDPFTLGLNSYSGVGAGDGFGFLGWNATRSGNYWYLYNNTEPGSLVFPNADTVYDETGDGSDTSLHREDMVLASVGEGGVDNIGSNIGGVLDDHINKERALRVIGYYYSAGSNPTTGSPRQYMVEEFLIIKVVGYTSGTLDIEFVRRDNSCGYDLE